MQTAAKTYKFIGKVLPDGHLSVPEDIAKDTGMEFEVAMTPVDNIKKTMLLYQKGLIEKTGFFNDITKGLNLNADQIAEAARKEYGTDDVDVIMSIIRR